MADLAHDACELAFRGYLHGQRKLIKIRFSTLAYAHITARRWGRGQTAPVLIDPQHPRPYQISFTSGGVDAIIPWLLQFGGEVEVVQPADVRAQLRAAARGLALAHDRSGDPPAPAMLGDDTDDATGTDSGAGRRSNKRRTARVTPSGATARHQPTAQAHHAIAAITPTRVRNGIVKEVMYTLRNPGPPKRQRARDLPWAPPPIQGS